MNELMLNWLYPIFGGFFSSTSMSTIASWSKERGGFCILPAACISAAASNYPGNRFPSLEDARYLSGRLRVAKIKGGQMGVMAFEVCQRSRDARWIVRLGDVLYGSYLDREQALLDAVDAARDAQQCGREAQVWIRDRARTARIF